MKLKFLGVLLLISLMTSSVFATYSWVQADPTYAATDSWSEPNQWTTVEGAPPSTAPGVPPNTDTQEIKIMTQSWMETAERGASVTINSDVGNYSGSGAGVRISLNGSADHPAVLTINSSGVITDTASSGTYGLRVGSNSSGGTGSIGYVNQTGGSATITNVILGYAGTKFATLGTGYYTISGGTLSAPGFMRIGAGDNSTTTQTQGRLTVVGNSASISVKSLYVGSYDSTHNGIGELEFQIGASGVSPIVDTNNVTLDRNGASSTANLILSLTAAPPIGDILLVSSTSASASAVSGTFDTVTGDQSLGTRAANGDLVKLSFSGTDYYYNLYYDYDSAGAPGNHGSGNDIALVIPEPATIALLGLGLIAIRRNKK
jgi:hypothetical protein